MKSGKHALTAIRPTWGSRNRVLNSAMPAAGPRPGAIAAQLETLADWVEEQDGDSIAGQSAAACRHIAMQARQDRQDSQAVTTAGAPAGPVPEL